MNKPPYGNAIRLLDIAHQFKVSAQDQPNKTAKISAGTFVSGAGNIVEFNGGNTTTITPPTTGTSWTLVSISPIGGIVLNTGTTHPAVMKNHLGLALIFLKPADTNITNDMIFDVRPIFASQHYPTTHNELLNLTDSNAHPIASITGLVDVLADKVGINEFENTLLNKADVDGTISQTFSFNTDQTGAPAENVELIVKRGSAPAVSIRWNETDDRWEFTNDGNKWFQFSNAGFIADSSTSNSGTVKLSVNPVDPKDPIAVGDNDPRLTTVLPHDHLDLLPRVEAETLYAAVNHTHGYLSSDAADLVYSHLDHAHTDLLTKINADASYSAVNHTHDYLTLTDANSKFSAIDHTHPGLLAKSDADALYASSTHQHNDLLTKTEAETLYVTLSQVQDYVTNNTVVDDDSAFISKINADASYSAVNHTHDYLTLTDATTLFATIDHVHSDALTKTNADASYSAVNHTHDYLTLTDAETLFSSIDHVHTAFYTKEEVDAKFVNGLNATFTTTDGLTVTVANGLIISIA